MIEKMKMVCIVSSVARKDEMLEGLRELGLVHLAEKKAPSRAATERFESLSKTANVLLDYAPDKKSGTAKTAAVLSDDEFEAMYKEVLEAIDKKASLEQTISSDNAEIDRIVDWGNFYPTELKELKAAGYDIHFYRLEKNEYEQAAEDPDIKMVRLMSVDKQDTVAVMGTLPQSLASKEFTLPEKGLKELQAEIDESLKGITACEDVFRKAAVYQSSFQAQMLKAQNAENYSAADQTAEEDADLVWISGYLPEVDLEKFKQAASENGWAWAADDVSEDDEQIPTKMRFSKVSRLISPVLDILGILPGYYEPDISLWFLLFFTLFFAMILGDGAYGVLILLGTIGYTVKTKKSNDATYLLFVLSIATIVWGAITGTWFGMESAMKVPFLKALVIPGFASYPEYFGVSSTAQQNTVMKFSFSIGAIQMALGSLISVKRKMAKKDLSFVADIGWIISIVAMYLMALLLVIGENLPFVPIVTMIGIGFVLVICFGGMSPDTSFADGLKAGLANAFTEFLNTISCFGNVMSYIRLFAVGMAGLAISQSFNNLASGFSGPLVIAGVVIVVIGHTLNIVMNFLSVVVHGVRLNVMEFSGQAGLEWTGIPYEPFKVNDTIKK
jgi:V/A-type H+/Na+-transporting ATPase subunit I